MEFWTVMSIIWTGISTAVGVVAGSLITRHYSQQASEQLEEEAQRLREQSTELQEQVNGLQEQTSELRKQSSELQEQANELKKLTTLILRGLEDADFIELNKDAENNIVGLVFKGSVHIKGGSDARGSGEVIREAATQPEEPAEGDGEADNRRET